MSGEVEYLDTDDLVDLAARLLGDPPPVRDLGLLGAAAARPQARAFGEDAYPDIWAKAAALLHSVVKNHALVGPCPWRRAPLRGRAWWPAVGR